MRLGLEKQIPHIARRTLTETDGGTPSSANPRGAAGQGGVSPAAPAFKNILRARSKWRGRGQRPRALEIRVQPSPLGSRDPFQQGGSAPCTHKRSPPTAWPAGGAPSRGSAPAPHALRVPGPRSPKALTPGPADPSGPLLGCHPGGARPAEGNLPRPPGWHSRFRTPHPARQPPGATPAARRSAHPAAAGRSVWTPTSDGQLPPGCHGGPRPSGGRGAACSLLRRPAGPWAH